MIARPAQNCLIIHVFRCLHEVGLEILPWMNISRGRTDHSGPITWSFCGNGRKPPYIQTSCLRNSRGLGPVACQITGSVALKLTTAMKIINLIQKPFENEDRRSIWKSISNKHFCSDCCFLFRCSFKNHLKIEVESILNNKFCSDCWCLLRVCSDCCFLFRKPRTRGGLSGSLPVCK